MRATLWPAFLLLAALSLIFLLPFFWMFYVALSPGGTLDNFKDVLSQKIFTRAFLNSVFVTGVITLGNLFFALIAGYGLARYPTLSNRLLFVSILAVLAVPTHVVIIPLFLLIRNLGWYDTYWALIIPFLVSPLGILLLRQYILSLPVELEEAARLDGAGELKIIFSIIAPLAKPALAALAIQSFWINWNNFLFPFLFTSSENLRVLPVALAMYQSYQAIDWPHLFAASAVATLPVLLVFVVLQKQIIAGLTSGALKQ
jgi:multiple sugar transport system permease protein